MDSKTMIGLSVGGVILVGFILYMAVHQRKKVIEWLKFAVTEAERILGSKTGQLKLRMVWDWFCKQFPVLAAILPFGVFSAWVDHALDVFKDWIATNPQVKAYIEEDSNGTVHE